MSRDDATGSPRRDAPVEYGPVRSWYQRVRALAAGSIAVLGVTGMVLGVPSATVKVAAFTAVVVDAVVRTRASGGATGSLAVDAAAAGLAAGTASLFEAPLVAFFAYALAAALAIAGPRALLAIAAGAAAGLAGRVTLASSASAVTPPAAAALQWVEVGVWILAMCTTLAAAGRALHVGRERQEAALASVRRASEMKNEFVSMVTHELRTPLTNIAGFAMTLNETWGELSSEEIDEFLRIIVGESEHLANLVDDVLAIPRLEAGRLLLDATEFPLRPAAYRIANLLFPAGGEKSASVAIGGNVQVVADPNRVEQILRNLLENARKYGGDQVTVEAIRRGPDYLVVIADNGPGVPAHARDRIFSPFEQLGSGDTRTEIGFGLGLAVARHLVEAMGGRIWYESGFPVGARFCFTLPAATADREAAVA